MTPLPLLANRRNEYDGVGHADDYSAIRLPGDPSGLNADLVFAKFKCSANFHYSIPYNIKDGLPNPGALNNQF